VFSKDFSLFFSPFRNPLNTNGLPDKSANGGKGGGFVFPVGLSGGKGGGNLPVCQAAKLN
jgi:hypothetical protein